MTDVLRGGAGVARLAHNQEVASSSLAPATTPTLSPDEQAVLDVLLRHRGRGQAIHKEQLAASIGLDVRKVRLVIVRLIEEHGQPIGSISTAPAGYFLVETPDDATQAAHELQTRIVQLAKRLSKLKHSTTPVVLHQLALDAEPPKEAA